MSLRQVLVMRNCVKPSRRAGRFFVEKYFCGLGAIKRIPHNSSQQSRTWAAPISKKKNLRRHTVFQVKVAFTVSSFDGFHAKSMQG